MRQWSLSSIAVFLNTHSFPHRTLLPILAVIIAGSAAAPALAADVSAPDTVRWEERQALRPFRATGREPPPRLFLVRPCDRLAETDGVTVHGTHNGAFIVSGSIASLRALSLRGCNVIPLPDVPQAAPPAPREWTRIEEPDPAVAAMVDQVQWEGVRDKIRRLVDFGTRYCIADNHELVATSIASAFEKYGLQTTMHPFPFWDEPMWNIEATQHGARYPDSYVIICGHFDSNSEIPMHSAPGADDNGTGVAAVLTAAEILSRYTFEYSIRYICFDNEELGLVGSRLYANLARRRGIDIVGVLNFDMVGYWKPGMEKDLEIETDHASKWLAEAIINAAELYTDTQYEMHVYDDAWWADHWYFWRSGYAAVTHGGAYDWFADDFNPYYHTSQDRLEHLDPGFTVGNIKVGVASLATLAGYVPTRAVSFDIRPGSCPNPFNPESRGAVPALVLGSADVDVHDIDISSLRVAGSVAPSKLRVADMASALRNDGGHPCADMFPDGIDDLRMEISTEDIAAVLGPVAVGKEVSLRLTGRLADGTRIEGEDEVVIVGGDGRASVALGTEPPVSFTLHQNIPNPFTPTTSIRFDVPSAVGVVTLRIYDVSGRLVRTLADGAIPQGRKTVVWDGLNDAGAPVAAGVYFCRLTGPGLTQTRKMMLLK